MSRIEIEIANSDVATSQITALTGLLLDPTPILDEAAAVLLNRIRRNFLTQTAPDGTKWPRSYSAERRRQAGRGGGTLFDTGRLFRSIQLFSVSPTERSIATDVEYAPVHQYGMEGLPARTFLGFSEVDAQLAQAIVIRKFQEAMQ